MLLLLQTATSSQQPLTQPSTEHLQYPGLHQMRSMQKMQKEETRPLAAKEAKEHACFDCSSMHILSSSLQLVSGHSMIE